MVETITFPQYFTVSESFLQGVYQTELCVTHTKWMNKPRVREAKELHMQGHSINSLRLLVHQTASFHMKMTRGQGDKENRPNTLHLSCYSLSCVLP